MASEPDNGTYSWRVVASPAIVTAVLPNGRRVVAAPSAKERYHRIVEVWSDCGVGTIGELRYVSNPYRWGRVEFDEVDPSEDSGR